MSDAKVIYLTGGAQGIGLGIAEYLLARGERVALTDIDAEALAECRERLGHPDRLLAMVSDVSDERQVAETLASGRVRGTKGRVLILERDGTTYAVDLRDLVGHEVTPGAPDRSLQSSLGAF